LFSWHKILTGKYDSLISVEFRLATACVTRGNLFKIIYCRRQCHYNLKKYRYSFSNWTTDLWNSLFIVVVTVPSLKIFNKI